MADNARAKQRDELAARHAAGQLALWPESERGIPNELVRCAVFSAKNRKERRDMYRANAPLVVPVIGGGEVVYIGEELRQDDETVWMQLVHMSKESRSPQVFFTPYSPVRSPASRPATEARPAPCYQLRRQQGQGGSHPAARARQGPHPVKW